MREVKNFAFLKLSAELEEGNVGKQNLPPRNVSLWHKDYLIFNKQKTEEEPLTFLLTA